MALSDLVNDPYSAKRYLAEIGAYDIAGTATITTKRAPLAHNQLYEEFCRDD